MYVNAYLNFKGTCEAAFRFYEQCFGGKNLVVMKNSESPMADKVAPEMRNKVLHARLIIGETTLMGSDAPPEYYEQPAGFAVVVSVATAEEAERIFAQLAQGGKVRMALQETFWATRYGMVTDRFGTPWMVNCEKAS